MKDQIDMFIDEELRQKKLRARQSILPSLIYLADYRIKYFRQLIEKIDTGSFHCDPILSVNEIRTGFVNGLVNAQTKHTLLQAEYESIKDF